ncbi:hypothetical protein B7P43_G01589 [Cryptotermes secundus]|uniref:Uncharacterized protein n=1 Tax=Cryptotermes secundus TaxID=105785 RepID=A0A2J7RHW0_9NEOP|nr:hypothetical protein B7P43_G01589 [Cryptotermes secundus]
MPQSNFKIPAQREKISRTPNEEMEAKAKTITVYRPITCQNEEGIWPLNKE